MVVPVPSDKLYTVWGAASKWVHAAMNRLYLVTHTLDDVAQEIQEKKAALYVVIDDNGVIHGAMVMDVLTWPRLRAANVRYIGGRMMAGWRHDMVQAAKDFAKSNGCSHVIGGGRSGWAKIFGAKKLNDMIAVGV